MPIAYKKPKKHTETIRFMFQKIHHHNRGSGKSVFVINEIHKVQRIAYQIENKVSIEKYFLISPRGIYEKWKDRKQYK